MKKHDFWLKLEQKGKYPTKYDHRIREKRGAIEVNSGLQRA